MSTTFRLLHCLCDCRYGTGYSHAYGSEGYHHYMRNYDPSYSDFYSGEGPSVEDKWRSTYPYVPTSYSYNSIDGKREREESPSLLLVIRVKFLYTFFLANEGNSN